MPPGCAGDIGHNPAAHDADASFLAALGDVWPAFFAFTVSFFVIAAFWVGHYRTFRYVVAADGRLVAINFFFLFCIASLPFPTSTIATHGDLPIAVVIYGGWIMVTGLLSTLLWVYPSQFAHLVSPAVTPQIARWATYRAAVIPVTFAISMVAGLVAPAVAWARWILAAPIQVAATRWLGPRIVR
jgi:TMEM175 potassium channel family protein